MFRVSAPTAEFCREPVQGLADLPNCNCHVSAGAIFLEGLRVTSFLRAKGWADAVFGIGFGGSHAVHSFEVKVYVNIMAMHHHANHTPIMAIHHVTHSPPLSSKKGLCNPYNAVPS